MSSRTGFALAVGLLLIAAVFRFWSLATLPPGLTDNEVIDIRIAESVRAGRIEVFYDLNPLGAEGGREGLYHVLLAALTMFTGTGLIGYRVLSIFIALPTLALVYAVGMRLYGPAAGVLALALLAVGMWPVLLGRIIGPETMLPLLVAATMLALIKALPVYQRASKRAPSTLTYGGLGVLLGLSFYIHPASFLITLFAMLFIAAMVISPARLSRRTISYISFAILLLIILVIPYLLSSIRLPGLDGANRVFGDYRTGLLSPFQAIWNSILGVFFIGDASPAANLPARPLFDLVSGVLIVVGLVTTLRFWKRPRYLLLLLALVILGPLAALNLTSPDFTRFAVLMPVLALFFGLGATTLYRSFAPAPRRLLAVGLLALFVFNVVWAGRDLFTQWPALPAVHSVYHTRLSQLARHIDLSANTLPTIICTRSVFASPARRELSDTQLMLLMMHRRNAPTRFADCGTGLVFAKGGEQQQVILTHPDTMENIHPYLRAWLEQGTMAESDVLPADSVILLDVTRELAARIGLFTTTAPVMYAPETEGGAEEVLPPVRFGGNLALLGYEPSTRTTYAPGSIVTVITYWRVDGLPPPDMRLFTHILSDPANIVAQTDTRSVLPSQLQNRDVFIQITFVPLPLSIPPGTYTVSVGAYQDRDRMRLNALYEDQPRGTRLFLEDYTVVVAAPPSESSE